MEDAEGAPEGCDGAGDEGGCEEGTFGDALEGEEGVFEEGLVFGDEEEGVDCADDFGNAGEGGEELHDVGFAAAGGGGVEEGAFEVLD